MRGCLKNIGFLALILLIARYSEPIVVDWIEDKSCVIGSVSADDYEIIRTMASHYYSENNYYYDRYEKSKVKWHPSRNKRTSADHLNNLIIDFVPLNVNRDEKIAYSHALMRAFGGRPNWYYFSPLSKELQVGYIFYNGRNPDWGCLITCLLPTERYLWLSYTVNELGSPVSVEGEFLHLGGVDGSQLNSDVSIGCPQPEWFEVKGES